MWLIITLFSCGVGVTTSCYRHLLRNDLKSCSPSFVGLPSHSHSSGPLTSLFLINPKTYKITGVATIWHLFILFSLEFSASNSCVFIHWTFNYTRNVQHCFLRFWLRAITPFSRTPQLPHLTTDLAQVAHQLLSHLFTRLSGPIANPSLLAAGSCKVIPHLTLSSPPRTIEAYRVRSLRYRLIPLVQIAHPIYTYGSPSSAAP